MGMSLLKILLYSYLSPPNLFILAGIRKYFALSSQGADKNRF